MRFVFDPEIFDRKKSRSTIKYPLSIDMAPFVRGGEDGGSLMYDLKGVLLHIGQSAHHGHYTAQVFDSMCVI
jgi:Ubiquitin carboxyl-terminal hydrolase